MPHTTVVEGNGEYGAGNYCIQGQEMQYREGKYTYKKGTEYLGYIRKNLQ